MKYRAEVTDKEQLSAALKIKEFEYVYAPMDLLSDSTPDKERIIVVPPVFLIDENKTETMLAELRKTGFNNALIHTLGHIGLVKNAGLIPFGGFRLNITNSLSFKQYVDLGLADIIFSVELSLKSGAEIERNIPAGIIAYGKLPLMVLRRCPVNDNKPCGKSGCKQITDRLGNKIDTICKNGEIEVLNPAPIILSDKTTEIKTDFSVLRFTGGENISEVLKMYKNAVKPDGEFTRGLYFKRIK